MLIFHSQLEGREWEGKATGMAEYFEEKLNLQQWKKAFIIAVEMDWRKSNKSKIKGWYRWRKKALTQLKNRKSSG